MENKQTAVQWLIENLYDIVPYINEEVANKCNNIAKKAIVMEQNQIEEAYLHSLSDISNYINNKSTDYFNKTFNKQPNNL